VYRRVFSLSIDALYERYTKLREKFRISPGDGYSNFAASSQKNEAVLSAHTRENKIPNNIRLCVRPTWRVGNIIFVRGVPNSDVRKVTVNGLRNNIYIRLSNND